MIDHYNLVFCLSPNFGDAAAPYLFEKIAGHRPVYTAPGADYPHYIATGSVLNWSNHKSQVWGAGLASLTDQVDKRAHIHAVRGPLSRMQARMCGAKVPEVYGDPALLLPLYVKPSADKRWDVGVFPHYVDLLPANDWFGMNSLYTVIDPLQPVEEVVRQVTSCKRIISSALHGLVVADAYGIPNALVKMSDSIGGDGMKYRDYLASVGRIPSGDLIGLHLVKTEMLDLREYLPKTSPLGKLNFEAASPERVKEIQGRLLETCPFKP